MPAAPQLEALRVPEGGCRIDAPGCQGGHRVEPDRDPIDGVGVGPVSLQHRVEDRIVGGKAGHSHRSTLQITRAADVGRIEQHRGQRALHDRRDPHHVKAALARQAQVVDVEDRELGPAGLEQLRSVGRARRLLHAQVDPRVAIVAALEGRIDAGVHGVRLEVEDEGRFPGSARFSAIPAAAGDAGRDEDGRQQRDDPFHRGAQDSLELHGSFGRRSPRLRRDPEGEPQQVRVRPGAGGAGSRPVPLLLDGLSHRLRLPGRPSGPRRRPARRHGLRLGADLSRAARSG